MPPYPHNKQKKPSKKMTSRKRTICVATISLIAITATVIPLAIIQPWKDHPPAPPPSSTHSSPNTPTSSPTSSPSATSGQMTYYAPGLGACGITSSASDNICAISHVLYDAHNIDGGSGNPNENPLCGHRIRVMYEGRSLDVRVVDRCEACAAGDLDLSPGAFGKLEGLERGRVDMRWVWVEPVPDV